MLKAKELRFAYGKSFELENVSLEVEKGAFLGIIGPNGSGKSTLLKILSKVLRPQSGNVELAGISLNRIPLSDLAKRMAVVGSEAQFSFPYQVKDVVLMGRIPFVGKLAAYSSRDWSAVDAALQKTETWNYRDRYIHELSSGERQRVLLARALAQEPQILLLDEPTAHLDLHYEIQIFQILQNLNRSEQLTIVTVSHNINLMAEFAKTLLVLFKGRSYRIGPPSQILTPDLLQEVFRIDCRIEPNPFSQAPTILLKTS